MNITITGKIKPYVRMTQKSKFCDPQAQEYLASKAEIQRQIVDQMEGDIFDKTPLRITGLVITRTRKGDLDNIIKALMDSMQSLIFANDLWVDDLRFIRHFGKEEVASIVVEVIE